MEVLYGNDLDGMLDAGAYVFDFQIRVIVAADRIKRNPIPDKFEHVLHGDSCAGDTRFFEMYIWGIHLGGVTQARCSPRAVRWRTLQARRVSGR